MFRLSRIARQIRLPLRPPCNKNLIFPHQLRIIPYKPPMIRRCVSNTPLLTKPPSLWTKIIPKEASKILKNAAAMNIIFVAICGFTLIFLTRIIDMIVYVLKIILAE
ncbi:MAG: hypothetical protein Harvfovirus12_12 [Harvfovirus sp.]|uniref:Uncharacterized protein n=1 Tax=Harvfovirus sp. TaxID=2487768 RepID=A0A3G5A170_9VIRU|nr:MAG: hypothetical protein Harvfovirus12_12 [Harvfovirus sp.]